MSNPDDSNVGVGAIAIRLGRVVYVVCCLAILIAGVLVAWPHKYIRNATVVCIDGMTWDATGSGIQFSGTDTYWPREKLCGLCTKRSADKKSYNHCTYAEVSQVSVPYRLEKIEYEWSPRIKTSIVASIIITLLGIVAMEVVRMTLSYVIWGRSRRPFWLRRPRAEP